MPITVNQTSDQIEFGDTTNSFSVPMGNFALVKNDHETVRYLKSTGFASCLGLILHSAEWTLLAHFQSANWGTPRSPIETPDAPKKPSGIALTITAFGHAGIVDYSLYEGFGFLGSNVNVIATSKT